ncbi:MAG: fibrillarin-like rRNA/tRNA 2'-O-methyltransferase [Candidatus Methanoplasma sp.]|jgi:fibrillarin-like pre-rRNA processing protein|nr:fibrillarin-like rRNA/tRNA 2'-O-methyltransferase [Candidatus Methanoplasma sp.]
MRPLEGAGGAAFEEDGRLYTESAAPGTRVYGERVVSRDGAEYREWSPHRSKLSAYLAAGGRSVPFGRGSEVLYLGASSGTTASHVSDIVSEGRVYCVEFSPRAFRDLVAACGPRPNMIPILGDAMRPSGYGFAVGGADAVYSDVAQKRQADIALDNAEAFGAKRGMIAVKARSEDVTAPPERVFRETEERIRDRGYRIVDAVSLEPFEKAHEMIVFEAMR